MRVSPKKFKAVAKTILMLKENPGRRRLAPLLDAIAAPAIRRVDAVLVGSTPPEGTAFCQRII
jgi:hypothetical protein